MGIQKSFPVIAVIALCGAGWQVGSRSPYDATTVKTCLPFDSAFVTQHTLNLISNESAVLASIADVALSSAGHILIADRIDANVKIYDDAGNWVRTLGRLGDGPGEFRRPIAVAATGDSVFVLDARHARLSLFLMTGQFLESIAIRVIRPSGLGIAGDSLLLIAGHGRVDEVNALVILPTLHTLDFAGNIRRSHSPERKRERLYEANFSEALLDVHRMRAVLGDRTSNIVRIVNLESDSTQSVTLTPTGYSLPRWPRRRFTGEGSEQLRRLTDWANAQSWLLGLWYLEPGFVLGRFSNPIDRHLGRYALAALDGGPAPPPPPLCSSTSKVAAVHHGREMITYETIRDTTKLRVRQIRIAR